MLVVGLSLTEWARMPCYRKSWAWPKPGIRFAISARAFGHHGEHRPTSFPRESPDFREARPDHRPSHDRPATAAALSVVTSALVPEVIGPVPGSNPPWGGPSVDVASAGYVVEEFYLAGTTTAYDLVPGAEYSEDGRWTAAAGGTAPYVTRILVVRPREPAAFNGTVVLNWQNVSAGYEYGGLGPGDEALEGYAWVGVSAQEVGIYGFSAGRASRGTWGNGRGLRAQDPERYGPLRHPGDRGSFEIFAQAARAVGPARDRDVDPMCGLEVQRVIATGASESAMRLATYANAVHPLDPVVDAFLFSVWEGRAPRLTAGGEDFYYVPTTLRTDLVAPTVIVNSEFEVLALAGLDVQDHENRRLWEVAGTPHGVWPGPEKPDERGVVPNRLSYQPVQHAALRQLNRWLTDGTPAPHQPRIQHVVEPRPAIVRDPFGNAVGGFASRSWQRPPMSTMASHSTRCTLRCSVGHSRSRPTSCGPSIHRVRPSSANGPLPSTRWSPVALCALKMPAP